MRVPSAAIAVYVVVSCTPFDGGSQPVAGAPGPADASVDALGAGTVDPPPPPSCTDAIQNGTETGVDCGGLQCPKCALLVGCSKPEDCTSNTCVRSVCVNPKCADTAKGGDETDVDCGGSCARCDVGMACTQASDCKTGRCDGSVCTNSASCRALRADAPTLPDGIYTIDPDGAGPNPPFDVFCDMTTDGGGWTFFAHVNEDYKGADLFVTDTGSYRADRADDATTYGRGQSIVQNIAHTNMMVTLDTPFPLTAQTAKKIVFYEYEPKNQGFNAGPIPCKGMSRAITFSFRIKPSGEYLRNGNSPLCDAAQWFSFSANVGYLVGFSASQKGNHWGRVLGGNDTWGHESYWYVR